MAAVLLRILPAPIAADRKLWPAEHLQKSPDRRGRPRRTDTGVDSQQPDASGIGQSAGDRQCSGVIAIGFKIGIDNQ